MKVLELPTCPACGSSSFEAFTLGGRFSLRRCRECETVSALDYADPTEVYVDGYMFGEVGEFGLDVRAPLFQQYLVRVANRRVNMIEKATGLRCGTLLDVGSGTGEVLLAASGRGWSAKGVEPERTAAEMARDRGQDVTISTLEQSGIPERSFDVVSAFHVLEHMPDSRAFLRTMSRWARPGGFLVDRGAELAQRAAPASARGLAGGPTARAPRALHAEDARADVARGGGRAGLGANAVVRRASTDARGRAQGYRPARQVPPDGGAPEQDPGPRWPRAGALSDARRVGGAARDGSGLQPGGRRLGRVLRGRDSGLTHAVDRVLGEKPEAPSAAASSEMPSPGSPPVTVAVVSWNTRELLVRCLRSLEPYVQRGLAQVSVVDNCSTDGSARAAREAAPWAEVIEPGSNLGFGRAVNVVASQTRSPWLACANADVALEPGALEALLAAGTDGRVACVAPRLVLADGATQHSVYPFPTVAFSVAFNLGLHRMSRRVADSLCLEGFWDPERRRDVPWAIGAFLLLRRSAFEAVGGFDERQFIYAEDLDLGWRLHEAGWITRYEPGARALHFSGAAMALAFGDQRLARYIRATYAVILRRRGLARTWATAALNVAGAAARLAWMVPLAAVFGRWREPAAHARLWLAAHRQGLRSRSALLDG